MGRIIGIIASSILIFFGVLFILGSGAENNIWWVVVGIVMIGVAIGIIWITTHRKEAKAGDTQNVTLKIDLPGNVSLDTMKCKSCGGNLSAENVKMVAGAPQVTCPFCHTQYQLTEDPKW